MGARPTKLRNLYKKLAQRQKTYKIRRNCSEFIDDERSLLLPRNQGVLLEMDDSSSDEIKQMKEELSVRIQEIHIALDELEFQQLRELDQCGNRNEIKKPKTKHPTIVGDPILEECRLKNALVIEKLRCCQDQLSQSDETIVGTKSKDGKNKDTFLRQLLVKTAKRQFKKSRMNDALETFYQIVVATNGQLCGDEAWLLFDICSHKIAGTYEFYHRIAELVRQLDPGSSKYIVNELWSSIVNDLRSECSEMYDVAISVRVEIAEPLEESCVVEKLKYVTLLRICALWLQITPVEHQEFEDIKDLLYDSLSKAADAFKLLISFDNNNKRAASVFHSVIDDLHKNYPTVSKTRKFQKVAEKVCN